MNNLITLPRAAGESHDVSHRLSQKGTRPVFNRLIAHSRHSLLGSLDSKDRVQGFAQDIKMRFSTTGILSEKDRAFIKQVYQKEQRNILQGVKSPNDHQFDVQALLDEELEMPSSNSRGSKYTFFPAARLVTEDRGDK